MVPNVGATSSVLSLGVSKARPDGTLSKQVQWKVSVTGEAGTR